MFPWATIVSLGAQFVGQGLSAYNNKKQQEQADASAARREAYYVGKAAENPLSTSSAQAAMGRFDRDAKKQVETARNVSKITGATPEYSVAVQQGVAEGKAALMSGIAEGASQRSDRYEDAAERARFQKEQADQQRLAERQQTYANLVQNAGKAFGTIMDSYGSSERALLNQAKQQAMSNEEHANNLQRLKTAAAPNIQALKDKYHF